MVLLKIHFFASLIIDFFYLNKSDLSFVFLYHLDLFKKDFFHQSKRDMKLLNANLWVILRTLLNLFKITFR